MTGPRLPMMRPRVLRACRPRRQGKEPRSGSSKALGAFNLLKEFRSELWQRSSPVCRSRPCGEVDDPKRTFFANGKGTTGTAFLAQHVSNVRAAWCSAGVNCDDVDDVCAQVVAARPHVGDVHGPTPLGPGYGLCGPPACPGRASSRRSNIHRATRRCPKPLHAVHLQERELRRGSALLDVLLLHLLADRCRRVHWGAKDGPGDRRGYWTCSSHAHRRKSSSSPALRRPGFGVGFTGRPMSVVGSD
jgi:hypothetical protein